MDIYDIIAIVGLGMLGAGLWMFSPALSLSVTGAIVLAIGFFGSMWRARASRGKGPPFGKPRSGREGR